MAKRLKEYGVIFVVIFVAALVYSSVGPHGANDFPVASQEALMAGFGLPQSWTTITGVGIGEYSVGTLWSWPLDLVYALGSTIHVPLDMLMIFIGIVVPFYVSYVGIAKLVGQFTKSRLIVLLSWMIFALNTYPLLLVDGGQLSVHLAYSILPLALYAVLSGNRGTLREKIISGFAVAALGFADVRFVYILLFTLGLKFFVELLFEKGVTQTIRSWFTNGAVTSAVFFSFHAYWMIPLLLVKAPVLPISSASEVHSLNFTSLGHSLFLQQPHWYLNIFGMVSPVGWMFMIYPLLAISAFVVLKPKKSRIFWGMLAVIAIFLAKGANDPNPNIYETMFSYLPGFSIFRDSTKFFVLIAASYAVLSSMTMEAALKARKKWVLYLTAIIFLIQLAPVWTGQMRGILSPSLKEKDVFAQTQSIISPDVAFSRSLYIPARAPFGYSSPTHPAIDARDLLMKRPFITGAVGKYELFNSLRESTATESLFDVLGIKYVVYQKAIEKGVDIKQEEKDYYYDFAKQLGESDWNNNTLSDSPAYIYETKVQPSMSYVANKVWWVLGSDDVIETFAANDTFSSKNNLLVFANESPGMLLDIDRFKDSYLYLPDNLDREDVLYSLSVNFISPAQYIPSSPLSSGVNAGWWSRQSSEFVNWRDFLQSKYELDNTDYDYGLGKVVSEGQHTMVVPAKNLKNGTLGIRVMHSTLGGSITVSQSGKVLSAINTKTDNPIYMTLKLTGVTSDLDQNLVFKNAYYKWHSISGISNTSDLMITSDGVLNSVNALALLDDTEYTNISAKVNEIYANHDVYNAQKLADVDFPMAAGSAYLNKISNTQYSIDLTDVTPGSALVFSSSYNDLWRLDSEPPVKGYALVNAYPIGNDGHYELKFTAQELVNKGLVISFICVASVFAAFAYARKLHHK